MGTHAKRSPSKAKQTKQCPGWLALCEALEAYHQNVSGPAAKLGTAVHGLIEECLKTGHEPQRFEGRIIYLDDDENAVLMKAGAKTPGVGIDWFEVDEDIIYGASIMVHYVWERQEEFKNHPRVKTVTIESETRTNPLPDRDDTDGTADATIVAWPVLLEVADYKNGWNLVEHKDNDQLRAYLLGKALEWAAKGKKFKTYRVTVVQPHAPHEEGSTRFEEYTFDELLAFQKEYAAAIKKQEAAEAAPGAPDGVGTIHESSDVDAKWAKKYLNAGPDAGHCMFCAAAPVCPARLKFAVQDAAHDFDDDPEELPAPRTNEDVTKILAWAVHHEKLIAQAHAFGQREMQNGHKVPGYKLVKKQAKRIFIAMTESKLVASILKGGFIKDKESLYTKPKLISGPQAEALVPSAFKRKFAEKFLTAPDVGLTMVPVSDRRKEVVVNVGDDFEDDLEFDEDGFESGDLSEFG